VVPERFDPGPPPPIASALYVEEFEEVRVYGVNVGSLADEGDARDAYPVGS
jgi:hypothetical protein